MHFANSIKQMYIIKIYIFVFFLNFHFFIPFFFYFHFYEAKSGVEFRYSTYNASKIRRKVGNREP